MGSAAVYQWNFIDGPSMRLLDKSFFRRHPAEVAPDLLGKVLVRELEGELLMGRIVETEAYCSDDPASHTFRGQTARNAAMFGEVGCAYVYFIHGMHYCINVTARADTPAGGVLLRALEPLEGLATMRRLRGREDPVALTSGPAKLTRALAIDLRLYGTDMTQPGPLYLMEAETPAPVAIEGSPRIGISRAVDVPWRFVAAGSRYVSR